MLCSLTRRIAFLISSADGQPQLPLRSGSNSPSGTRSTSVRRRFSASLSSAPRARKAAISPHPAPHHRRQCPYWAGPAAPPAAGAWSAQCPHLSAALCIGRLPCVPAGGVVGDKLGHLCSASQPPGPPNSAKSLQLFADKKILFSLSHLTVSPPKRFSLLQNWRE